MTWTMPTRSGATFMIARLVICVGVLTGALVALDAAPSEARGSKMSEFAATLGPAERQRVERWYAAQTFHNAAVDAYWGQVARIKRVRKARQRRGQVITARHYVTDFPPKYTGPKLGKSLWRRWVAFRDKGKPPRKRRRSTLPDLADFLAASTKYYGFLPERIPEPEFKRRYAAEALKLGLTKEQVVRVYALETGGLGTADMVAGIHPIRRTGRPISSAMGYAQLLAANTLLVLQKHGGRFETRLTAMRDRARSSDRRRVLTDKIAKLRRMRAYVKKLPRKWSALQKASRTGRGRGVHAINIDGDIGPWVQVVKLRDVKRFGARKGRETLTPEQLELMNLAGPGTGIEMMTSLGSQMPTSNFFSRRGYNRNSIVRGRRAHELLTALGDRMDANQKNSGAREFTRIFDRLLQNGGRAAPRATEVRSRTRTSSHAVPELMSVFKTLR